jgi:sporulation-control protein
VRAREDGAELARRGRELIAGAAGLAVGVVGGMVAAEVVDEVGDFFEGEEEEEE